MVLCTIHVGCPTSVAVGDGYTLSGDGASLHDRLMWTLPPACENFSAFDKRFSSTWRSRCVSPQTNGGTFRSTAIVTPTPLEPLFARVISIDCMRVGMCVRDGNQDRWRCSDIKNCATVARSRLKLGMSTRM